MNKVSVIVPNHNRNLTELIKSVENSTYKNVEIVIVNLGLERSQQRNIGIDKATGEYLLFLDSDQTVSPDLIKECVELIKYCEAVYIPEIIVTKGFFGRLRNWERQFYTGTCVDVAKFIKKCGCPYFNETLHGPEDTDWDRRILQNSMGRAVSHNVVYHFDDIKFWDYCKKKSYYSKSMTRFALLNPGDKILNLKYRCFTVFIENGKWKRLFSRYTIPLIGLLIVRGLIWIKR